MSKEKNQKRAITTKEFEEIYGVPRGSAANMRWAKIGPRFFKAGPRRVLYLVEDVEQWIQRNPVMTKDSLPSEG